MDFIPDSAEAQIDQIITNSLTSVNSEQLNSQLMNLNMDINTNTNMNMDEENEEQEDTTASIEVFNTALHQYLQINEEIKSLMIAIKERNNIKRKLSDTLSNYLKAKQIKKVNLDGSYKGKRLEVDVKNSTSGFTKASVTEVLLTELNEQNELFEKIMTSISRNSVIKEVWKLKIIDEKTANRHNSSKKYRGRNKIDTSMADTAALIDDDI